MEINHTKLKHANLTLLNNFYGTKAFMNHFLTFSSQEHNLSIHKTLRVWLTKRKRIGLVTLEDDPCKFPMIQQAFNQEKW